MIQKIANRQKEMSQENCLYPRHYRTQQRLDHSQTQHQSQISLRIAMSVNDLDLLKRKTHLEVGLVSK